MREKRKNRALPWAAAALIIAVIITVFALYTGGARDEDNAAGAMEQAVMRCCVQCYAVEGVYPESLDYLEKNYGLRINKRDYRVVYDVFASNVPPEIRVVEYAD